MSTDPAAGPVPDGTPADAGCAVTKLSVGYAKVPVVSDIDLVIPTGAVVTLLGRNGAGKTTLLNTLAGLIPPISGELRLLGKRPPASLYRRVRQGVGLISEERSIIRRLSVIDNLRVGSGSPDRAFSIFPELVRLKNRRAGLLSGGEQQMLALGRVLAAEPKVLLIDELSQGLGPMIVERLLTEVRRAASEAGTSVLLVEQQAATALSVADFAYVISGGRIAMSGSAIDLQRRWGEIELLYLSN